MNIVIIGATGLVGSALVSRLVLNEGITRLTTITRKPIQANSSKHHQVVLNPMTIDNLEQLDLKAEVFICALGTTIKTAGSREAFKAVDHDLVMAFARLAKKSEAKAFYVVSALGANSQSFIFYNRIKGQMERDVTAFKFSSTYILKPSLLIGEREEKRTAESLGIAFYRMTNRVFPKKIMSKLGTRVEDIVFYVEQQLIQKKTGVQVVTDFNV